MRIPRWLRPPPRWARMIPRHLRPSAGAIEAIEAIRQRAGQAHEHIFAHVAGHAETTRRVMRRDHERAKSMWPEAPPRDLLRAVLLSRLQAGLGTPGRPLFGITPQYGERAMLGRIEQILDRYPDIESLADAINRDERRDSVPPWPGYESDAERISEILRSDNQKPG